MNPENDRNPERHFYVMRHRTLEFKSQKIERKVTESQKIKNMLAVIWTFWISGARISETSLSLDPKSPNFFASMLIVIKRRMIKHFFSFRYTSDFEGMRARRKEVRPKWLREKLLKYNSEMQKSMSEDRKKSLTKRRYGYNW